jgi:hypothetical protein
MLSQKLSQAAKPLVRAERSALIHGDGCLVAGPTDRASPQAIAGTRSYRTAPVASGFPAADCAIILALDPAILGGLFALGGVVLGAGLDELSARMGRH